MSGLVSTGNMIAELTCDDDVAAEAVEAAAAADRATVAIRYAHKQVRVHGIQFCILLDALRISKFSAKELDKSFLTYYVQ